MAGNDGSTHIVIAENGIALGALTNIALTMAKIALTKTKIALSKPIFMSTKAKVALVQHDFE
jgi:hypothetical protein